MLRPASRRRLVAASLATALGALSLSGLTLGTAAAARADSAPGDSTATVLLSEDAASAKAVASGKAVAVDAATTATESEVAEPDGTFTLNQSVTPVRRQVAGVWKGLDAKLERGDDGTVTPALTTSDLTLSGGGTGPLATMKDHGRSLALALPSGIPSLPAPTLSGDTATYADVLSGVDLKVTADEQGGFSEVLVVKNATAAANPALATLAFGTTAKGLTLTADAAGNIKAKDVVGRTVFAAPAPTMWDSATGDGPTADATGPVASAAPSAGTASAPAKAERLAVSADPAPAAAPTGTPDDSPALGGAPADSSADGPGAGAHVAPIAADYSHGAIELTPDASLLKSDSTVYPLYIDPSYAAGGSVQAWTYVASDYPTTSFWKTTDSAGLRVGYQGWESPNYTGRAFAQMSVDSRLYGAQILDSTFYATETYAPSCTATPVELWWTNAISSATTWNNQPKWNSRIDTESAAHGWSSSCPTASVGFSGTDANSNLKHVMQGIADGGTATNLTLGLRASDETDPYGWKKFDYSTMTMTTHFDHKPNAPTALTTSPTTGCTAPARTVGHGDISFDAAVSDPDGGSLTATFTLTSGSKTKTLTATANSGTVAVKTLKESDLDAWLGTSSVSPVSWNVGVSDGTYTAASANCAFTYDPTTPGAPVVQDPAGYNCGDSSSTTTYQVGTPATFGLTPNGTGTSSYTYQLNGRAPLTTTASSITVTPTRGTNVLTVTAQSSGGNTGETANCVIVAAPAATATDGDLTGDGYPDLPVVGRQATLPAGLWLARGSSTGTTTGAVTQIGAQGNGLNSNGGPTDWNGTQAVVGHFASGLGYNDVLDYNATSGVGQVLDGTGDGSPLSPASGSQTNVSGTAFQSLTGQSPATSVANGGNLYNYVNNGGVDTGYSGFPDLLLVVDGQLWDEPSLATGGDFVGSGNAMQLSASGTNPTGSGDWTGWTITSGLSGDLPGVFARSATGGQLYYLSPADLNNMAQGTADSPVQVAASGWTAAAYPVLQAADLNHDGTTDLRAVSAGGTVTGYLFNGTALTAQPGQALTADSHTWPLTDGTSGTATTAADTSGSTPLPLTGAGAGAVWDTADDLVKPELTLNGTSSGVMTAPAAVDVSKNFSVSVWAKPTVAGGVILSQAGNYGSGFLLYPTASAWQFCTETADAAGYSYNCAAGGAVHLGVWAHLNATYNASTKMMALYLDGHQVATATHTPVSGWTGKFQVGEQTYGGTTTAQFTGSLSAVQTWNQALTPAQVADLNHGLQPVDGLGVWRPGYNTFYLGSGNTSDAIGTTQVFGSSSAGDIPLAGDWNGSGRTGYGIYRPSTNTFYLHDGDHTGGSNDITIVFGSAGDVPVVGDWYGNGKTTVGVWRPSTHTFLFPNSNTDATVNHTQTFGASGDVPVAGDWNGSGKTGYGVYRPSTNTFYLHDGDDSSGGGNDFMPVFGTSGDVPVVGDWYGDGHSTVGVWRPSTHTFLFPNSNTDGTVNHTQSFGATGDDPVIGHWNG